MERWRERLEPLDASVHRNISPDEHLPAGAENPWTTWKALNRLRSQVGRSRVNMLKWGFSNEQETCDCGIRQTMQHLLVCPMMDTACSPQDLATANGIAIGCAKHWEGTIWRTYDSWWKDKNDAVEYQILNPGKPDLNCCCNASTISRFSGSHSWINEHLAVYLRRNMRIDSHFCPVISTWLNGSQRIQVFKRTGLPRVKFKALWTAQK